jgi:hypothetical protein
MGPGSGGQRSASPRPRTNLFAPITQYIRIGFATQVPLNR